MSTIIVFVIILFLAVKFIGEKVKLFSANRKGGWAK